MADLKSRFILEGEQQYRQAMTNAANAVRVLNSEQKLAAAQYKNTGDAQKYAADQARILQEKIKQQETIVKAAQKAMEDLTKKGVAENTREFQQWQTKLNNAQTTLTNMQTELANVNSSFQNVTTTAQETASAVESVGKNVSYSTVIDGIGKITDKMGAAAGKAKELAGELVNTMKDAAAWADDLATQASVYGIDTQTLQRMRYTANIIDTSVESIIKSRQKLVSNMAFGGDEIQNIFDELGVATQEMFPGKYGPVAAGFRDWEDVLWDIGDALLNIEKTKGMEQASAYATKLLGRSWEQLRPLFEAGRKEYEEAFASWSTVSDENVGKLGELDDAIQKLNSEFEVLKLTVLSELAPGFTVLADSVTSLLKQFNDYLATDAGKQKLGELSDAVTGIFEGLTDIDFDTALSAASTALTALTDGLGWIKDNWGTVEAGLGVLAGSFGALKISEGVLKFMQILAAGKFLLGTTAAGDAAKAGAEAGAAWGGGFASAVLKAAPWLALIAGTGVLSNVIDKQAVDKYNENTEKAEATATAAEAKGDPESVRLAEQIRLLNALRDPETDLNEFNNLDLDLLRKYAPNAQLFDKLDQYGGTVNGWLNSGEPLFGAAEMFADDLIALLQTAIEQVATAVEDTATDKITQYRVADEQGSLLNLSAAQAQAIEQFWDWWRVNGNADYSDADFDSHWSAYEGAFAGDNTVFQLIDGIMSRLYQSTPDASKLPEDFFITPELPDDTGEKLQGELNQLHLVASVTLLPDIMSDIGSVTHAANGLFSVPYDGYPAILHKGERVMTAREAGNSYSSNLYVESMYMNNGTDAAGLAAAMAAAQRRTMAGYGS